MLAISWDTLIVGGIVGLLALYLFAQLALRFDGGKLFAAWRLARRHTDKSNAGAGVNGSRRRSKPNKSPRRRVS